MILRWYVSLLLAGAGVGCVAPGDASTSAPLPSSCEAFLTKYEHCLAKTFPRESTAAADKAAQTRATLRAAAMVTNPAELSEQCSSNLKQTACDNGAP